MINKLIDRISTDLDIKKGLHEDIDSWQKRVIYSCIGMNMLASAYDYDDFEIEPSENTVSMQHVKNRGDALAEILTNDTVNPELIEEIRDLYIRTGFLLHKANRLTYPNLKYSSYGDIYFSRGQTPWTVNHISGLALFATECNQENTLINWEEMFCIEEKSIMHWYEQFEKALNWSVISTLPADVEYINISESQYQGYWQKHSPKSGITLCRDQRGVQQYQLIKITDKYMRCNLPDWRVAGKEYIRIALALRIQSDRVPSVTIRQDGKIAEIYADYLLPPFEQNMFELFSWPDSKNISWNRVISIKILPLMIELFTRMGFKIIEE